MGSESAIAATLAFALLCCGPAAQAECVAAPERTGTIGEGRALQRDEAGRAVAPVIVNGEGPFRFIIDTGANRTAISADLARRLDLVAFGVGDVHAIDSVRPAPFVRVRALQSGALRLANAETPVLDGEVLAGEDGFLGVDGLAGRAVLIDYDHRCVEIGFAIAAPVNWVAAPGHLQYGSSFVMRGRIQDTDVTVLIDTGSNISLGNVALRNALRRGRATFAERHGGFVYTAGRPIVEDTSIWTPSLHLEGASVRNVSALIGNFHIFDMWGLNDRPTLLIGMDILSNAGAVLIDYQGELIYFRRQPHGPH